MRPATYETRKDRVLLLTSSFGLGGGIERYADTLQSALRSQGFDVRRLDLLGPQTRRRHLAHFVMYSRCASIIEGSSAPVHLVALQRSLLANAWLLSRRYSICRISLVCHGNEIWLHRNALCRLAEQRLMRGPIVRLVAVSAYTAGALVHLGKPVVVPPPGLSESWFAILSEASESGCSRADPVELVTAFRLRQWRDKGLAQVLDALEGAHPELLHLTICGSGELSTELREILARYPWCTLELNLQPRALAARYARADLMVLATQARFGRRQFCESFGLVLVEAQVAGTAVAAPAYGGSTDALLPGVTGLVPSDQSAATLRACSQTCWLTGTGCRRWGRKRGLGHAPPSLRTHMPSVQFAHFCLVPAG